MKPLVKFLVAADSSMYENMRMLSMSSEPLLEDEELEEELEVEGLVEEEDSWDVFSTMGRCLWVVG